MKKSKGGTRRDSKECQGKPEWSESGFYGSGGGSRSADLTADVSLIPKALTPTSGINARMRVIISTSSCLEYGVLLVCSPRRALIRSVARRMQFPTCRLWTTGSRSTEARDTLAPPGQESKSDGGG